VHTTTAATTVGIHTCTVLTGGVSSSPPTTAVGAPTGVVGGAGADKPVLNR